MATDISIKAKEMFLTIPDVKTVNDLRAIDVTKDQWYSQIFLAKANQISKIFFLANLPNGIEPLNNLKIQLYSVSYDSGNQKFSLGSKIGDEHIFPYDIVNGDGLGYPSWYQILFDPSLNLTNTDLYQGENMYYSYVFSSNCDSNKCPKIYYSQEYRQSIFPIILSSLVVGGTPSGWTNNLVSTYSAGSGINGGGILFGYVGNQLGDGTEFDSGTISLGSGVSAKRGYGTFIHIENSSTQFSGGNSLSINFSQLTNDNIENGLPEETDVAMMRWYYFSPKTLPIPGKEIGIYEAEDSNSVLDQRANFVVYYQPDRFPPYPKVFGKESEMFLKHSIIPNNVIYQSTELNSSRDSNPILVDDEIINDVSDNFSIEKFANFKMKKQNGCTVEGTPYANINADYIDFTLEDTKNEIKEVVKIKLSADESKKIRGFTNIIRFKNNYIAFPKYETQSDGWFFKSAPTGKDDDNSMLAYMSNVDNLNVWNPLKIKLEYSGYNSNSPIPSASNDVLNWYIYNENKDTITGTKDSRFFSRIVGVYDSIVRDSYNAIEQKYESTLFVIFQIFPCHIDEEGNPTKVPSKPFFAVGWLRDLEDDNSEVIFKIIQMQDTEVNDARFDPQTDIWGVSVKQSWIGDTSFPRVKSDYKGSFFILPDSDEKIYITARNPALAYKKFGINEIKSKFGLWSIDLGKNLEDIITAPLINTSGTSDSNDKFDFRGFNQEIDSEIEISYVLKDGSDVFFGTCTYSCDNSEMEYKSITDSSESSYSYVAYGWKTTNGYGYAVGASKFHSDFMGEVYLTSDFIHFNQVVSGATDVTKPGQEWLIDVYDESSWCEYTSLIEFKKDTATSYTFPHIVNDRVAYMTKVNNILHIWLSPSVHNLAGTPFHIACNISTHSGDARRTRLLRKFPITNLNGDTLYSSDEKTVLGDYNRSKNIRKIYGGIQNGHSIMIVGTEGEGNEFKRFFVTGFDRVTGENKVKIAIETYGLDPDDSGITVGFTQSTAKIFEDFTSVPYYVWVKGAGNFPYRIILVESGFITIEVPSSVADGVESGAVFNGCNEIIITTDHYFSGSSGLRWVIYDDRTLNILYDKADPNKSSYSYSFNYGYAYGKKYPNSEDSEINSKLGYYNGVTVSEHFFYLNSTEYSNYPAISVDKENKRKSIDVGIIHGVRNFDFSDSYLSGLNNDEVEKYLGLYRTGSIVDDIYNINPRIVNQNGVTYLICDNGFYSEIENKKIGKGYRVYKTYALKQKAELWGGENQIDFPIFNECLLGSSSYSGIADKVYVSETNGITFITALKEDYSSALSGDIGKGYTHSKEVDRVIYVINNGISLPQSISFFYKLAKNNSVDDIDYNIFEKIDSSKTEMVLKWANTWEDLYSTNNSLSIGLAQAVSDDVQDFSDIVLYKHTFPTDLDAGFFRLESTSLCFSSASDSDLITDENKEPACKILIKGLRTYSVDLGGSSRKNINNLNVNFKEVAITGIVSGKFSSSSNSSYLTMPEQILNDSSGCILSPGGYVIVDFPKPIYIDEVEFSAKHQSTIYGNGELIRMEVSTLSVFRSQKYGFGAVSDSDWENLDGSPYIFDPNEGEADNIIFDSIRRYVSSLRIKISNDSGLSVVLFGLKIKSIGKTSGNTFETFGVSNGDLIVVDDVIGLLHESLLKTARAYSSFNKSNSYLIYDLGEPSDGNSGFPVNRISMNILCKDFSRKIAVDVWDGVSLSGSDPLWENTYNGKIVNYQYTFVKWTPGEKINSKKIKLETILDNDENPLEISPFLKSNEFSFDNLSFSLNNLQNYSFKPNYKRDDSLVVTGSNVEEENKNIFVNSQMDKNGPFGLDIDDDNNNGHGVIEKNLNITFPLRQIRKIRIRMVNSGRSKVNINGIKTYTPLIRLKDDGDNFRGDPIWPKNEVSWTVKFSVTSNGG